MRDDASEVAFLVERMRKEHQAAVDELEAERRELRRRITCMAEREDEAQGVAGGLRAEVSLLEGALAAAREEAHRLEGSHQAERAQLLEMMRQLEETHRLEKVQLAESGARQEDEVMGRSTHFSSQLEEVQKRADHAEAEVMSLRARLHEAAHQLGDIKLLAERDALQVGIQIHPSSTRK